MKMRPSYAIVRLLWRAGVAGFFRRVDVEGAQRVPATGPVLLVPNHTNAFVDAVLLVTRLRRPVTLTAKSTLRGNPMLLLLIRALGVIELHRASDVESGADPRRNRGALGEAAQRLRAGGAVCVFPEGISHSDPALRAFRSGAARIALEYETARDEADAPLRIVPVGIHYERKEGFRSAAAILFGEPMRVDEWRAAHPAGTPRELTDEIERRVRELTINFAAERESEAYRFAAELLDASGRMPAPLGREAGMRAGSLVGTVQRLQAGAAAVARERPDALRALEERARRLRRRLAALGVAPAELYLPVDAPRAAFFTLRELELTLIGFPLALWGTINHFLPYRIVRAITLRISTDRDHYASNAIFMSLPVFLLFYAVQAALVAWFATPGWAALYLLALPYTGAIALLYRDRVAGAARRIRTFFAWLRRPERRAELAGEADAIVAEIRRLDADLSAA